MGTELDRERRDLLGMVVKLDQAEGRIEQRSAALWDERLPKLATFDPASADALGQREHARHRPTADLAQILAEDAPIPPELPDLVRETSRSARAQVEAQERARERLERLYVSLTEWEQTCEPLVRRGFHDLDHEED